MGMLKEFRDFAIRGNAVDMAIGIIIGAAFGKIITSLVKDVVMPPIGLLIGRVDFSNLSITLQEKSDTVKEAVTINYGLFINNVLDFVIVAFCIFMVIKQMNRVKLLPSKESTTKVCPRCQSTIPIKATRCAFCTSELEG